LDVQWMRLRRTRLRLSTRAPSMAREVIQNDEDRSSSSRGKMIEESAFGREQENRRALSGAMMLNKNRRTFVYGHLPDLQMNINE